MSQTLPFSTLTAAVREARPQVALVLGSGMGPIAARVRGLCTLPFADLPGMAAPSVEGHRGHLRLGDWAGKRVLIFEGRLHYYEGHAWRDVTQPVSLAAFLGAKVLLLTNAAGGIHDALVPGSLMAVRDHLEWTRSYCWRHPGPGGLGLTRPSPYAPRLLVLLARAARARGMELHQGVYAAVTGPNYETPAEVRALKLLGADAVGMSTAREVQKGHDEGMECAALSCITNRAAGLGPGLISHEEVLATTSAQCDRLADLLEGFLQVL